MKKQVMSEQMMAAEDMGAVDYRLGAPWDFGLAPETLRQVMACTKARIMRGEVPFGGSTQLLTGTNAA